MNRLTDGRADLMGKNKWSRREPGKDGSERVSETVWVFLCKYILLRSLDFPGLGEATETNNGIDINIDRTPNFSSEL